MSFHIDLKSFINIFEVSWNQLSKEQKLGFLHCQSGSEGISERRQIFRQFKDCIIRKHMPLIIHEYFHFWQGFSYPFLYLIECATHDFYKEKINSIRNCKKKMVPSLGDYKVYTSEIPFSFITKEYTPIKTNSGDIKWEVITQDIKESYKLSLSNLKLIEGAASLYQYKTFAIHKEYDSGNPKRFSLWVAQNSSYTDAYEYMVQQLGEEFTFFAFIPLITAVFHTDQPLLSFIYAISNFSEENQEKKKEFIDKGVIEFFEFLLNNFEHRLEHLSINNGVVNYAVSDLPKYISPQFQLSIDVYHPVLTPYRNNWISKIFKDNNIEYIFLDVFSEEHLADLINVFRPPISNYIIKNSPIIDKVISGIVYDPDTHMRDNVELLLAYHSLYNFIDSLYSIPSNIMTTKACPWINCHFFKTGLCKGHLNPPSTSEKPEIECSFPQLIKGVKINLENFLNQN